MKQINNLFRILLVIALAFTSIPIVSAAGSATVSFSGADTAVVGGEVKVTLVVSNISGATGISAIGGELQFDTSFLEYVKYDKIVPFGNFNFSEKNKMLSCYAGGSDQWTSGTSANIMTLYFKAKKAGTTTITLNDAEVSGASGKAPILTSTTQSKSINIKDASTNNNLASLTVSTGTLSPAFSAATTDYTVNVPNNVTSITINATAADSTATVSGTGNKTGLKEGDNKYTIAVKAQSGATKSYIVTVKRAAAQKSGDSSLSGLTVNKGSLSPTFNKDTKEYSVTVPSDTDSITVTGTPSHNKATVKVEGNTNLKPGENTVKVTVTAEDGTSTTYTIKVNKESVAASNDATLKNMSVAGYEMSPAFSNNTLEYNVTVPNDSNEVIINTTPNNDKAKVTVTGNKDLKVGNNVVEVKVTAEDGTEKIFKINVTKEEKKETPKLDGDATLNKLTIGSGKLSPSFNKNTTVYSVEVGSNVTNISVDAIPTSSKATVEVIGNNNLKNGMNTVQVVVTAENGTKNIYILNVNRKSASTPANKSNDNYLTNLNVSGFELSPSFNKDNPSYSLTIPYDVEKLDINYSTSNKKAKVEVIGNDSLLVGKVNTIQVKVTAEDGSVRMYTINATRSAKESNNKLKSLSASNATLSPNFNKEVYNYHTTVKSNVKSLDLSAIAENEKAKVEIEGNKDFKIGNNTVLIKVTDENGFMRLYQIDVEKKATTIFGMSIGQFIMFLLLGLGLLGILIFLLLLLKKRKDQEEKESPIAPAPTPQTPIIDFKPEFNFGSRNGTDDDVVYPGGNLNQDSTIATNTEIPKKLADNIDDAYYEELADTVYDDNGLFDATITKDELIAAIREGMQTKNADKLKMLLKQDELNQLRKKIKEDEARKRRSDRY